MNQIFVQKYCSLQLQLFAAAFICVAFADDLSFFGTSSRYPKPGRAKLRQHLDDNVPDNCEAIDVNILARHGTRYPQSELHDLQELEAILRWAKDKKENVEDIWLEKLKKITYRANRGQLSAQGREDMIRLGARIKYYWPELFRKTLKEEILIESSSTNRTVESAYWLFRGIFDSVSDTRQKVELSRSYSYHMVKTRVQEWVDAGLKFRVKPLKNGVLTFFLGCQKLVSLRIFFVLCNRNTWCFQGICWKLRDVSPSWVRLYKTSPG